MQEDDGQLLKAANHVLQFTMFHLVKELRGAGIEGQIHELPSELKSALLDAIFGGISEINSDVQAAQIEDWDSNSKVWALLFIFGESKKDEALLEISRVNSGVAGEEFGLCGMYAARSLITALECGDTASAWLDSYEGMFAAMARLSKAIA